MGEHMSIEVSVDQWVQQKWSDETNETEVRRLIPELAALLKSKLRVPEVTITVGIPYTEFDELDLLMIEGRAA